jgi:hypothetical protein
MITYTFISITTSSSQVTVKNAMVIPPNIIRPVYIPCPMLNTIYAEILNELKFEVKRYVGGHAKLNNPMKASDGV